MLELSNEDWAVARDVYEQALELPPPEREAYVRRTTGTQHGLMQHVLELLAAADDHRDPVPVGLIAPEFVNEAFSQTGSNGPAAGDRVGAYRLIRLLGEGGMGSVFLAERDDEALAQRVAIKFVRDRAQSRSAQERFLREEQILAGLVHPGIARLYDASFTESGQPYFVMEYVKGTPITDYCALRKLPVSERLALFVQICDAVGHAQQHLVVHRDLKPSNILVTEDGSVKLLDFGIAKVLGPDTHDLTVTRTRFITPMYAAPEQLNGGQMTTATDVFGLGVVLFELLTGRLPYSNADNYSDLVRAICETDPPLPSSFAGNVPADVGARDHLAVDSPQLRRQLRGDLDTIVLKALRKQPKRRYENAHSLAGDIKRFRAHTPILARRSTFAYRLQMFIRRHPVAAPAIALLAAGFIAMSILADARRRDAERERDLALVKVESAMLVAEEVKFAASVDMTLPSVRRAHFARRMEIILGVHADKDPRALSDVFVHIGNVYIEWEDSLALVAYNHAQRLAEECCGEASPEALAVLMQKANRAPDLGFSSDSVWALILRRSLSNDVDTTQWNFWRMRAHMYAGRWREALRFQEALDQSEFPNIYSKAQILARHAPEPSPAFKRFVPLEEATGLAYRTLEIAPFRFAEALATAANLEIYRANFVAAEKLLAEYSEKFSDYPMQILRARIKALGADVESELEAERGHLVRAESLAVASLRHYESEAENMPGIYAFRQLKLGSIYLLQGRFAEAEALVLGAQGVLLELRFDTWPARDLLVRLYVETGRLDEARAATEGPAHADYDPVLRAWVRFLSEDYEGAQSILEHELQVASEGDGIVLDRVYHGQLLADLAAVSNNLGKHDEGAAIARESVTMLTNMLGVEHWKTAYAISVLGESLSLSARTKESSDLLAQGYAILRSTRGPKAQVTQLARLRVDARD